MDDGGGALGDRALFSSSNSSLNRCLPIRQFFVTQIFLFQITRIICIFPLNKFDHMPSSTCSESQVNDFPFEHGSFSIQSFFFRFTDPPAFAGLFPRRSSAPS